MTREIPRVLLAARGSASSRRATEIAADLDTKFNAQLAILHVAVPLTWRVGRLAPTLPVTHRREDPLTNPVLLEARHVAWARDTSARTLVIEGDTAQAIVTVAGELGADLLMIGSNRRLLPNVLTTHTGRWVRTHAPCPVLPVTADPPAAPRAAASVASWPERPFAAAASRRPMRVSRAAR